MKRICRKISCNSVANKDTGFCDKHIEDYKQEQIDKLKLGRVKYNRYLKDRPYIRLYNTTQWRKLREAKLMSNPICEICEENLTEEIHHVKHHYGDEKLFYDFDNLQSLCKSCHSKLTQQQTKERLYKNKQ